MLVISSDLKTGHVVVCNDRIWIKLDDKSDKFLFFDLAENYVKVYNLRGVIWNVSNKDESNIYFVSC